MQASLSSSRGNQIIRDTTSTGLSYTSLGLALLLAPLAGTVLVGIILPAVLQLIFDGIPPRFRAEDFDTLTLTLLVGEAIGVSALLFLGIPCLYYLRRLNALKLSRFVWCAFIVGWGIVFCLVISDSHASFFGKVIISFFAGALPGALNARTFWFILFKN